MHHIIDGRGSGKTSQLMLLAKENGGCIVCSNPDAMRYKASRYGVVGLDFASYGELLNGNLTGSHQPLYIDELDGFLKALSVHVDGYTLTNEE